MARKRLQTAPGGVPVSIDKVDVVVENWFPRFLANGLDYFDVRRTLREVADWGDWAPAWTAAAERYADLGQDALARGHRVTAADHLRRAALTLQFAQFVLDDQPRLRRELRDRQVQLYAACAPLCDPPARPVRLEDGTAGYLRSPHAEASGLVVLLPGLESTKEQFSTYEPFFLDRGMATLSLEGPGQGAHPSPFRVPAYAAAMTGAAARLPELLDHTDVPDRVVVLGTSFGGHLALRFAAHFTGLRGIVDIAGPYDLAAFEELQQVTQESFREFVGAADLGETEQLLRDVTLEGTLAGVDVPVLVVHGEKDTIIPIAHAHRIAAELGTRATTRYDADGNHSCNNISTVVRPFVADWVADLLEDP
jgi:pimeloyl-ACP methyl ester carboxylesterase